MSHWAEIDENNIVLRVLVGDNNDPAGDEGYTWLVENLGGNWIKTSYNTINGIHKKNGEPFRKNYAGVGYTYDSVRDAFIPPKIFNSWTLNEETCSWDPPIPKPEEGFWMWNEENLNWIQIYI
jgi:hypothetical protein